MNSPGSAAIETLHLVICGGAGDGKSTLIDRLLRESKGAAGEQRKVAESGSEHGDAVCRFFATDHRRHIVADTAEHEQYIRNITGASAAQLAILLVDAGEGVLTRTRRHSRIVAMMGIRHVVLAVNKMDLVGFDAAAFARMETAYRDFARDQGFATIQAIPLSALEDDNILESGARMPWYTGPTLLQYLDTVAVSPPADAASHGDVPVVADRPATDRPAADRPPQIADQFEAQLLWMAEQPLLPGRSYLLKLHAQKVTATITAIKYQEDVNTGAHLAAKTLQLDAIAMVNLSTSEPVAFEPYALNRVMGGFTLIDKLDSRTVGVGMIVFALRRAMNIYPQALEINKAARAALLQQTPHCIWFTGLSGSGKSTIANLLEKRLHAQGRATYLLDGDNVRYGLNRDLGFTEADRVENIRRVAEVAKLMVDAGMVVLVSFISPYAAERRMARALFAEGEFIEVFVDTPLAECERRDAKGLYAKARAGVLKNFTGIDSAYEAPDAPDVHLHPALISAQACADLIAGMPGRSSISDQASQ